MNYAEPPPKMTTRSSVKGTTRRNTPPKIEPSVNMKVLRFWQREEMGISCASTDTIRFVGSSLGYPKNQKCQLGGIIPDAMGVDSSCEIMPSPPLEIPQILHMVSGITRRHTLCSFTRSFHNLRISFRRSISRRSSNHSPDYPQTKTKDSPVLTSTVLSSTFASFSGKWAQTKEARARTLPSFPLECPSRSDSSV